MRIVGSLGQPLLLLVALGFGLGPVFAKAGTSNYLQMLAPGIIAGGILFTAVFSGVELIMDRQFGFLKETLVAPVSRWHIMLGRTLGGATVAVLQGVVVFLLAIAIGFRPTSVWEVFPALFVMFLIAMLFAAFGTTLATKMRDMQAFPLIMNFLIMPCLFLSGAFFPVEGLPKALAIVVKLNPLAYGVDGLRAFFTGQAHFGLSIDITILSILAIGFTALGAYFFERIEA